MDSSKQNLNDFQLVMNNTKWNEIRLAMYSHENRPKWRTRCVANGYVSEWDYEWYYHFSQGGYDDIEWLEIVADSKEIHLELLGKLRSISVPGVQISNGFRIYGFVKKGESIDYL